MKVALTAGAVPLMTVAVVAEAQAPALPANTHTTLSEHNVDKWNVMQAHDLLL